MSVAENKNVVRALISALESADFDAMMALLDDDIRFYVIGSTQYSGLFEGKQRLLDDVLLPMAAQRGSNGYQEEILALVGEDDVVSAETRGCKTTISGQTYNNEYAYFFRFSNGKVKEWRCYLDTELLSSTHT